MASAKQIIRLDAGNKIYANEEILREILLQPSIKDKKVCVVAIAGTFRQGKSFLLNFLIRYLKLKYKSKKSISDRWIVPEDGNILGFPWKCGSDRHTAGIMMWSEVFLAEMESGEEIAVVLLDSQGTFDNKTSKQHCAAIFAISTLISSVLIFNLKEKITQYDLEHLECFSGFGQLAFEQNCESYGPPFQNLCFLIRDWPYRHEFDFGVHGGKSLLQKVIDSPESVPQELKEQKENVVALFDNISCCLLPHPGQKVASDPDFQGNYQDIDPKFIQYVEDFVPFLLAPEKLLPKTINGDTITVSDLFTYIQMYSTYFSSGKVPPLQTMFMASAEAQLRTILNEAENFYKAAMDAIIDTEESLKTEELEEHHLEIKQNIIDHFNNKKIMGNNELKMKYKEYLKEKLEQTYIDYRRINRIKQEKEEEFARQEEEFQKGQESARQEADEEFRRKLDELKDIQMNLERQLWEQKTKHNEEKFEMEVDILKQQQAHQEEIHKRIEELTEEKQRRLEDKLASQQALFEEEQRRKRVEMEAEMEAKINEIRVQQLGDDKTELTQTVEQLTRTAENLKDRLREEERKNESSGCIIS